VPSLLESAPTVMKEQEAVESFVSELEASSDLMALAHVCSVMTCLALEEHLRREGKDNHATAFLHAELGHSATMTTRHYARGRSSS
jgi:hypothetical protein